MRSDVMVDCSAIEMSVSSTLFNTKYVEYLTSSSHICYSYYKAQRLSVSRIDTLARVDIMAKKFMALRNQATPMNTKNCPVYLAATRPMQSVTANELRLHFTL